MRKKTQLIESILLSEVYQLLSEIRQEDYYKSLNMTASLEKELGFGSLEQAELLRRLEEKLNLQFSDEVLTHIKTLNDILDAIKQATDNTKQFAQISTTELEASQVKLKQPQTLNEVLAEYAHKTPQRLQVQFIDEKNNEYFITYGHLQKMAEKVANGLWQSGIRNGNTVAIMLPSGQEFFYAFIGVLLIGAIPVPIYPPFRADALEEYAKREAHILNNAEVRLLITFPQVKKVGTLLRAFVSSLATVTTVAKLMQIHKATLPNLMINNQNAALIQYTSGSTSDPKGVLLTHKNILVNIQAIATEIQLKPTDVAISWLPLYHDMGLIGSWLFSLYHGIPITILSPLSFLLHPERWLWGVHYRRATLSAAPNFAYELCVNKISDDKLKGLDLSSWRLALNGAEAVSSKTINNFCKRFKNYGFDATSLYPVYGLAENTVALCFPKLGEITRFDKVQQEALDKHGKALPCDESEQHYYQFVSCGKAMDGHAIKIVDHQGKDLPERHVGELLFQGPSMMVAYYKNPEATQRVIQDSWCATGDLAYIADGDVYITGRLKDLIIKAGRNIFPEEFEAITATIPRIRKGCVVAFGLTDQETATEQIVIVAETHETDKKVLQSLRSKIIEAVTNGLSIPPDKVILVPPKTVPKTSSGKLRRSSCKQSYLRGELTQRTLPAWVQICKLSARAVAIKFNQVASLLGRVIYSAYVACLIVFLFPLFWLQTLIFPRRFAAWLLQKGLRNLLRIIFCPLKIIHKERLNCKNSVIYAVNHSSFLDTVVLLACLPTDTAFVGKKELLKSRFFRVFVETFGHVTVDRFDFGNSLSAIEAISEQLKNNRSILIFPEATFSASVGLRPFKLGAFKIAAQDKVPIQPLALQGTRKILRGNEKLVRPGKIQLYVGDLIYPEDNSWDTVMQLHHRSRQVILEHCGEYSIKLIMAGVGSDSIS